MTLSTRMISVLTAIGLLSGGFLAGVGILTKERIALNKQREIEAAILEVVPGTASSTIDHKEENMTVYAGKNTEGELIGYSIYVSGTGFQDIITLMFGTDPSMSKISRLTVLEQKETPGLGAKIADWDSFLQYWVDRDASQSLSLQKPAAASLAELDPSEVNTITGATISSEKVMEMVNGALEKLKAFRSKTTANEKK
ncbi:MAG: FMN-binding protein [Candidatus Aminicenantes bacterium]|nr:FMN-binding protein [Candidatus Aminicenantes bacterium]